MSQEPSTKRARTNTSATTNFGAPDPSTWTFTPKTSNTGTTAYINDAGGNRIRMQLPRMRVPFGFREAGKMVGGVWVENTDGTSRPSLELDVSSPDVKDWGERVDRVVVKYIAENSEKLMKRKMSEDFVSQIFRGVIPPARTEYNPLLRTKITKTGEYATKVFVVVDEGSSTTPLRHVKGTFSDIGRNDEVVPVIDVTGVWFSSNSAGMTLGLSHVLVYKKSDDGANVFDIPGVAGVECAGKTETPVDDEISPAYDADDDKPLAHDDTNVDADPFA